MPKQDSFKVPLPRELFPALADVPEQVVPPGRLVSLGDNERLSDDSRRLGYFALDRVVGVMSRRLPAPSRSARDDELLIGTSPRLENGETDALLHPAAGRAD